MLVLVPSGMTAFPSNVLQSHWGWWIHSWTTVALESDKGTENDEAETWTQTWTIKKVVSVCSKSQPLK